MRNGATGCGLRLHERGSCGRGLNLLLLGERLGAGCTLLHDLFRDASQLSRVPWMRAIAGVAVSMSYTSSKD
jgi:hypothetical protein